MDIHTSLATTPVCVAASYSLQLLPAQGQSEIFSPGSLCLLHSNEEAVFPAWIHLRYACLYLWTSIRSFLDLGKNVWSIMTNI